MYLYRLITSGATIPQILMLALAFVISAFSAIIMHENMHGLVAHWCGDDTAKIRGRLTLNPLAHFDVLGLIMFLFVGFGWAKPVPINPDNFKNRKLGMILVSIAGVGANFIMAGIGLLLLYLLFPVIIIAESTAGAVGQLMLYFLLYFIIYWIEINFMLGAFNLLPIYPLDGFNLINSFLPEGNAYARFMRRYGTFVLLAIIAVGQISSTFSFEKLDIFGMFSDLISQLIVKVTLGG